jgi:hypothetical protein
VVLVLFRRAILFWTISSRHLFLLGLGKRRPRQIRNRAESPDMGRSHAPRTILSAVRTGEYRALRDTSRLRRLHCALRRHNDSDCNFLISPLAYRRLRIAARLVSGHVFRRAAKPHTGTVIPSGAKRNRRPQQARFWLAGVGKRAQPRDLAFHQKLNRGCPTFSADLADRVGMRRFLLPHLHNPQPLNPFKMSPIERRNLASSLNRRRRHD